MVASVPLPALTMITMRRGRSSEATNSSTVSAGTKVPSEPWSATTSWVLLMCAVEKGDPIAVTRHVAGQAAAHHRHPNNANLSRAGLA